MHGHEVEELDDAGGIDLVAAAIAGLDGLLRVAEVHEGDGDLVGGELLRGETFERPRDGLVHDFLEMRRMGDRENKGRGGAVHIGLGGDGSHGQQR